MKISKEQQRKDEEQIIRENIITFTYNDDDKKSPCTAWFTPLNIGMGGKDPEDAWWKLVKWIKSYHEFAGDMILKVREYDIESERIR